MALTLSAVVVFGILAVVLLRGRHVSFGTALVLFLFGFFVAGTGAYKPIHNLCQAVADALTHLTA
ncbi:hypothetical protein [Streptomyces sp. NRRL S-1448]|uniref:hypothetical protein n=1 Tax=Streptomyces sp. NRRL S-1448 TaxID=1463883 RepID=UPI0004BF0F8D|nr:hypothetical protein [Streptomyces sp. NRRL S-1448]